MGLGLFDWMREGKCAIGPALLGGSANSMAYHIATFRPFNPNLGQKTGEKTARGGERTGDYSR